MGSISSEQEYITISLNEYKELLVIKGRYEELKSKTETSWNPVNITYSSDKDSFEKPYKVTCKK